LKKLSLLTSLHSPSKANRHPHRKIRRFIPAAKRSVQIQRSVGWKKEFIHRAYLIEDISAVLNHLAQGI